MMQYIFESWVWSIGGLFVGYILGRAEREIREIRDKVDKDNKDDHSGEAAPPSAG